MDGAQVYEGDPKLGDYLTSYLRRPAILLEGARNRFFVSYVMETLNGKIQVIFSLSDAEMHPGGLPRNPQGVASKTRRLK